MRLTFVLGTGRCGSTLMHEILAKHEHTSFVSAIEESHGRLAPLTRVANSLYRQEGNPLFASVAKAFRPTEAYRLIERRVSPIYSRPFRDLTDADVTPWLEKRFRDFFATRFDRAGQPVMVHKYTGWSRLRFFASIFPEARFVHVVRDGRAVANSWLQMRWWDGYRGTSQWQWGPLDECRQSLWDNSGRSYVALAALCWDALIESFRMASRELESDRYLEIRYEDFLSDPADHCRRILDFMGLPWNAEFERQLGRIPIRQSRKAAYQRDLSASQIAEMEQLIQPTLRTYGYSS